MTSLITPTKVDSAVVSLEEMLRRNAELHRSQRSSRRKEGVLVSPSGAFSVKETSVGYQLRNVPHHDGVYDLLWSKVLLPGDGSLSPAKHLQDDWLSHPEYRMVDDDYFDLPSGPEYASTLLALYHHRNTVDPLQQRLLADFQGVLVQDFKGWIMTSTRITYRLKGLDIVAHCCKRTTNGYVREGAVAGEHGLVNAAMSSEMGALFGVVDVQEFMDAIKWLTEKEAYLWRIKKPKNSETRVLMLGVSGSGWFDVYDDNLASSGRARGVIVRKNSFGDAL